MRVGLKEYVDRVILPKIRKPVDRKDGVERVLERHVIKVNGHGGLHVFGDHKIHVPGRDQELEGLQQIHPIEVQRHMAPRGRRIPQRRGPRIPTG